LVERLFSQINVLHEEAQYIIETKDDTIPVETSTGSSYQVSAEIVAATLN
jgi:ribonuclease R